MTRPIVIACFLTLATMISCIDAFVESEKIDITNPNPPEKKGEFVSFNATLESPYTRAALDMSSTLKVSWEKGDRVRITDGQKTAVYQATSGGSSETVLEWFSGDTLSIKTGTMYKAFYPFAIHGISSADAHTAPILQGKKAFLQLVLPRIERMSQHPCQNCTKRFFLKSF